MPVSDFSSPITAVPQPLASVLPITEADAAPADPPELDDQPEAGALPATDDDGRELAGKRVVLGCDRVATTNFSTSAWFLLVDSEGAPQMYEGTRDEAIRAALDAPENAAIAETLRADPSRFLLNSVPAASWAPAPVEAKVTRTMWIVRR